MTRSRARTCAATPRRSAFRPRTSTALTLAERENAPGGLTLLRYRQAYQGIPAFDNGVRVAIDRGGRVLSLNGSPRHALSVASVTPRISATDALRALQSSVGLTRGVRVKSGPSGARRTTAFASGEQARLTLFGAAAGPRLAWRVDYKATSREHYDGVVDATSGRLLWRANRVKSFTGNVFDYYLGAPDGGTLRDQDLTTPGWLPSTATNLTGPNAHTWSDINDDNVAQPTEEVTPESGDFNFAFTPFTVNGPPRCLPTHVCGWDPVGDRSSWQANRKQSATQAFFLVNKFHDHLAAAPIGFDAASGSFQGDDPLLDQSFDGANTGRRRRAGLRPRRQREHGHAARRPVADDAAVPVRVPATGSRSSTISATTPRRSGTSTRTASRTASSSTATGVGALNSAALRRDGRGVERLVRRGPADPRGARDRQP